MPVTFPFEEDNTGIFNKIRRPVATVYFKHQTKDIWQPIKMLVDSGADYTLLPYHIAALLGIDLQKDCKQVDTHGVGGVSKGFLLKKKIKVKIGSYERNIPIALLLTNSIPPLLGRHEFFETFKVTFEDFSVTFE